jgi:hypothetical protein
MFLFRMLRDAILAAVGFVVMAVFIAVIAVVGLTILIAWALPYILIGAAAALIIWAIVAATRQARLRRRFRREMGAAVGPNPTTFRIPEPQREDPQ